MTSSNGQIGVALASQLGLALNPLGNHELAGPCIACKSSDAFHLHAEKGIAHCFSCGGSWSSFKLAEAVLGDRERAKALCIELGIFQATFSGSGPATFADPIEMIAVQKGVTADALCAYGATQRSVQTITLPSYGPDGTQCTSFTMSTDGSKGLFAKDKPAGLFFPHENGKVRLPKPGETWQLVEGPKDAAALWSLGILACGLNTCRLANKFARLFDGVDVILVPDRDQAGEDGAQHSARVLRGHAKSLRIAVLPAEFKDKGGDDVRDILKRPDGREQVLLAIKDAKPPESWESSGKAAGNETSVAIVDIPLPDGEPLKLAIGASGGKPQRLIVATRGKVEHRDRINLDSSRSREQFIKKLSGKLGMDFDSLFPLVEPEICHQAAEAGDEHSAGGGGVDESQATIAVQIASGWDRWHTPDSKAYATIPMNGHLEIWAVRSQTFKRLLAKRFFEQQEVAINSEALSAATNLIEAQALFDGEKHDAYIRIAEHEGNIYVDLCNDEWQVIEITPDGWAIVPESPVRFRRCRGMLPLPIPEHGDISLFRAFLNVDEDAWVLLVSWLVAALRPHGPYPILALFAEHGCGKSTIGRLLRALIDPNSAPLRAEPKDARDLMIAANNSWFVAYDNLSYVPAWLSDALCRLSTGGGFSTRELYSDDDEIIFESQRPALLTSIEEVATRSDLLDRCLIITLAPIPDNERRAEAEMVAAFETVRPRIIGALLQAVAIGLRRLPTTKLHDLPRMADFAVWASAVETAFGWADGTFMAAYQRNRRSANDVALEASNIARPLLTLLEDQGEWIGSASELLVKLEDQVTDQVRRSAGWPKNARSLSGQLKRLAPNLRTAGWAIDQDRSSKSRSWIIQRNDATESPADFASSEPSPNDDCEPTQNDANGFFSEHDDADDANDADPGRNWNPDRY